MAEGGQVKRRLIIGLESIPDPAAGLIPAASPLAFLTRALSEAWAGLIVVFGLSTLKERDALVELCGHVRANPLTRSVPLLCVVPETHRRLIARLLQAGVCWTVALDGQTSLEEVLQDPERFQAAEHDTGLILHSLCPFLRYQALDRWRELKVCGAYRDRMVLGRSRLEVYCHRPDHRACPFYLEPRLSQPSNLPRN